MNDMLVVTTRDTRLSRTYLTTLLSYGSVAKESWLTHLEGWVMDEAGKDRTTRKKRSWSSSGPMGAPSTSRPACTWTCCYRTSCCPATWMWGWYCPSTTGFHLIDHGSKPECHVLISEATIMLEVWNNKVAASEQLHLEKFFAKSPLAHVVTCHYILAVGATTAEVDALFTSQIPTKILIGLVSNEAFITAWHEIPFNFALMDFNRGCLVVAGQPLLPQPWWVTYTHAYRALMKCDIHKADEIHFGNNTRTKDPTCCLLLQKLSTEDSDRNSHLEVSNWQG